MAKKTIPTDYYVKVEPKQNRWGATSPDELKEYCAEVVAQIKRHVDNVAYVEVVTVTESSCEFCGYRWTEDSLTFNGCCEQDEKQVKP